MLSARTLIGIVGDKDIQSYSVADLDRFKGEYLQKVKPSSVNVALRSVKALFSRAVDWGIIGTTNLSRLKMVRHEEDANFRRQQIKETHMSKQQQPAYTPTTAADKKAMISSWLETPRQPFPTNIIRELSFSDFTSVLDGFRLFSKDKQKTFVTNPDLKPQVTAQHRKEFNGTIQEQYNETLQALQANLKAAGTTLSETIQRRKYPNQFATNFIGDIDSARRAIAATEFAAAQHVDLKNPMAAIMVAKNAASANRIDFTSALTERLALAQNSTQWSDAEKKEFKSFAKPYFEKIGMSELRTQARFVKAFDEVLAYNQTASNSLNEHSMAALMKQKMISQDLAQQQELDSFVD
jgi:enamine deaminase RidA (YjgF/YER057c/UK114 family)